MELHEKRKNMKCCNNLRKFRSENPTSSQPELIPLPVSDISQSLP